MNLKRILTVILLVPLSLVGVSAQVVEADTLGGARSVAVGPVELLGGELSGVRVSAVDGSPNGLLNVNIRGLNTLRGDSQPLWIVDGAVIGSSINQNLDAFYQTGGKTSNGDDLPDYSGQYYNSPIGNFSWLSPYEVESIQVLKDISATALYGMQGANGVIIVKTRKPKSGNRNIWLDSSAGVSTTDHRGEAFGAGIVTSHNLGVNGIFGQGSYYNISGFIRYNDSPIVNTGAITGGLAANIEMTAGELFGFGFNSYLSYGDYTSAAGTNFIGKPSLMAISRYPSAFLTDPVKEPDVNTLAGWVKGFDDETIDCRTVNSVWLRINFLKNLHLMITGGMDYQNQTRYLWFGTTTSFGKRFSGATSILNNSLMNFNLKGELKFDRNFAVMHHLKASLAYDLNGNLNRTNAMCGTQFRNPALRGKGLTGSGSLQTIRKFDRSYTQMGAYAFVGYDYDGNAGLTAVARLDYTSRFDKKPLWSPSVEAFVDIKKICLKRVAAISSLKVTGGYGCAGREISMPYEYMDMYISNVPEVDKGTEYYFDGFNRLISKEWNVGLNAGLLKDRIVIAAKYYDKVTEDSFSIVNYGRKGTRLWEENEDWTVHERRASTIGNKGVEVDLDLKPVFTRNVKWGLFGNFAYNINRILSLDSGDAGTTDIIAGSYYSNNVKNASVGQVLGLNTLPKYHGGFGTTFSLYGFTLDARFSGAAGFSVINANRLVESGRSELTVEDLEPGDYLRLDNLTLSYDIPLKASWIKNLRVNISGHNLFTVTDYSGWNPDVNSFGVTTRSYGVDYASFPICRSFVLGLSIKF